MRTWLGPAGEGRVQSEGGERESERGCRAAAQGLHRGAGRAAGTLWGGCGGWAALREALDKRRRREAVHSL